jgi:hypothetical protein
MLQATSSPFFPVPVMTCLPGLSPFFTHSQFLIYAHASIARETARDLDVFAQGYWSLPCWQHPLGARAIRPSVCVTAAHGLSSP